MPDLDSLLANAAESDREFLKLQAGAPPSAWLAKTGLLWARTSAYRQFEPKFVAMAANWNYEPSDLPSLAEIIGSIQYFDFSREQIARLYRAYNTLMQRSAERATAKGSRSPRSKRRLRIGYLSSDFRRHVMGDLMLRVLRCHDRSRFEINAYSLLPRALEDAYSVQFQSRCNRYVRLAELDDSAAAERIADDGLDLLVDLTGHTPQARPAILLRKPAPVIVGHLGDHGTVGVEQVDFKLTDAVADLPDAAEYQVEKPLAMEGCVMPFRRVTPSPPDPDARARLGIPMSAVVLGAFTSVLKLSPRCVELWRRILENVPSARLALSPFTRINLDQSIARLTAAGIPADRMVVVQPSADDAINRARYRHIDVLLDTLPYTGGDSTVAALDMGVPVVTRAGERQAERMGLSILTHLGMTDTVAWTDDEYVAVACRLATDAAWRAELSTRIRDRIEASGIADFERYTRNLEDALERALTLTQANR